jgi:hypothetical protein
VILLVIGRPVPVHFMVSSSSKLFLAAINRQSIRVVLITLAEQAGVWTGTSRRLIRSIP